jgi:HlyD family type I secretion membrane fusion protein
MPTTITANAALDIRQKDSLGSKLKGPKIAAVTAVALFGAGLLAWSSLAPLSSATVAAGIVSPDSGRMTVQHLEGGIVDKILVTEGEKVSEGQLIAILVDSKVRSTRDGQTRRRNELLTQRARLDALATNADKPDFSRIRTDASDTTMAAFVENESALFQSRRAAFLSKIRALKQEGMALDSASNSSDSQLNSAREELDLLKQELQTKADLYAKGLTTKPIVQALDRRRTQIEAQIAQLEGQHESQASTMAQKKSNIDAEIAAFRNEIAEQAAKNSTELASLESALSASDDAVRRMEVRAPEAGTIVSLKVRTPGAVIAPGAAIADFVPSVGGAVLDVRVKPADISRVQPGQNAQVTLTAYSQREVPMLPASVKTVGADAITDPATREIYYKVELRIDDTQAKRLAPSAALVAGMPVETYISHHERTLFSWLAEPVVRTFHRAAREY